ncbi:MAG: ATP-binding protein [Candidatus Eisenbacteria bacterium]
MPELAESAIALTLSEGQVADAELTVRDRDGHETVVSCNATTFYDQNGELQGVVTAARDITESSRIANQVREQAAQLSELHRRKDEFLAMLSHELRGPLAPITSAVELLELHQGHENFVQEQARHIIERQLARLQHLVDDLLDVTRITTGRIQLRREPVAVANIVEVAVETVRTLIEKHRHELTVSLPPEPIWLHGDAARLEQVLVNLLTNAAKYTNEGGQIWLTVKQDGDECELRVRDTGTGISPELLPTVFDLFTQAERPLDRSQGGFGIGLALVRRLTDLHGGKVEVRSSPGQGSEFVVRLKVLQPSTSEVVEQKAESRPTRPLRVLVVDDQVDTVMGISLLLDASGHEIRTAHDGVAAVQAALECPPDVVLLDIGLPRLNGYEVAKQLRQHPVLKDVVLVALTGYGRDSDRQASLEAGFNHHLVKPVHMSQLQQILASVSKRAA